MASTARFVIVDVFTDTPYAGNQLGVFTDARALSESRMRELTRELGFSECVFVLPPEADGNVRIRIFSPDEELAFAGHPVLGAAFALAAPLQSVLLKLETGAGTVPVLLEREGAKIVFGSMSQPIPSWAPFEGSAALLAALGLTTSELPVEVYDNGVRHVFVTLPSEDAVAALRPDALQLADAADGAGVSCFAVADELTLNGAAHVKTRMFAPSMGIPEDAATGSAAGPLAVHLARHGRLAWGQEAVISQGAEIGRPSTLYAHAEGSDDGDGATVTGVEVGGCAVVVGRGEFAV